MDQDKRKTDPQVERGTDHDGIMKNRCGRAINTNTAIDREEMNRLRREARRARKGNNEESDTF